jgi:hypothetical protein
VASGGLEIRSGWVSIAATPGLGVQVEERELDRFRVF